MGVSKSPNNCSYYIVSLIWVLRLSVLVSGQQKEDSSFAIPPDYEKPSVKIGVEIISSDDNSEFKALVDTWWKILAWSLAVLTLSCLCCYFSRCCYLCYDCCSDPFWGCCPHSSGCTRFLLMKGCCHTRPRKGGYDICQNNDEETARTVENDDDLSEEDFTLRTVESLEVDAMLSKLSPIKGKTNQSQSGSKVVTSTPRKKKPPKEKPLEPVFLEMSGEAESMPQLYPSHYFNIFNIFGIGCSNYKVAHVEENHKKYLIKNYYEPKNVPLQYVHNPTSSSSPKGFSNEESTIGLISDDDELEDRSFDRSVMNNQDFPLSSSFNNMYKKNGLHIEEGQIGRYHPLPEARFELIPPATFLRKIKRQNSSGGMHRRSRSMETFRDKTQPESVKKYTSGSLRRAGTGCLKEEDESSLPSPPPDPLSKVRQIGQQVIPKNDVRAPIVTCQNDSNSYYATNSATTTDEESERTHKRAHSEGSRIGHRRTPSMEGVIQLQNGGYLRKNSNRRLNQPSDLPPRPAQTGHKKRHSHRKMKMIDIANDEIEKCILYGKETTL